MDDRCTISESDVPWAKFVHSTVEEHTNVQLKRWLLCRGLTTASKRCDLIKRCQNALNAKVDIDPKVDGGKWHNMKLKCNVNNGPKVPILPISGWKKFPSVKLPGHFNSGHIYHYLVKSITSFQSTKDSDSENEDIHTSKPLSKGKNLFRSGRVKSMKDASKNDFYFVKSQIQASYAQVNYSTTLTISQNSGKVVEGTCTCSGSGLGRCSHVAALLFALEDFVSQFGDSALTCTQQLCQWNTGRRKDKNPSTVYNILYPTMKKEIVHHKKSADFVIRSDPRPMSLRNDTVTSNEINNFLSDLQNIKTECGWSNIFDFEYSDFTIEDYGMETLKKQCQEFHKSLEKLCHNHSAPFCVLDTENQNESNQWHANRRCRITASNAKRVACVKSGKGGFLQSLLWTSEEKYSCAMQYGKENESKAFNNYVSENQNSSVKETGLW